MMSSTMSGAGDFGHEIKTGPAATLDHEGFSASSNKVAEVNGVIGGKSASGGKVTPR